MCMFPGHREVVYFRWVHFGQGLYLPRSYRCLAEAVVLFQNLETMKILKTSRSENKDTARR